MLAQMGWLVALTISVCATVITAATGNQTLHMATTAIVCLAVALLAVREHSTLLAANASRNALGASTARYCGLIWAWGALAILLPYAFILESKWPEWWQFFLGFVVAAAASLMFAAMLERDDASDKVDEGMMKIGRGLVLLQLVGMIGAVVSLFVDGKFPRPVTYADWAGCNVFFFGALGVMAISANALFRTDFKRVEAKRH